MVEREEIVRVARSYINVPFKHQGRRKDDGVDCVGLLTCVVYDVGLGNVEITDYKTQPDPIRFHELTKEHLVPVIFKKLLPADVLTFAIKGVEQHFGLLVQIEPTMRFVHSYQTVGRCVEQELTAAWRRHVRGCYRLKEFC